MIPRKLARRLLDEYLARVEKEELEFGELDGDDLVRVVGEVLEESDLVLRGAENIEQKARRYLTEGRLCVTSRNRQTGAIIATCRGTEGTYDLGFDPKGRGEWRCTCPAPRRCAHLVALRLVTT